jgi:hypothetical protein
MCVYIQVEYQMISNQSDSIWNKFRIRSSIVYLIEPRFTTRINTAPPLSGGGISNCKAYLAGASSSHSGWLIRGLGNVVLEEYSPPSSTLDLFLQVGAIRNEQVYCLSRCTGNRIMQWCPSPIINCLSVSSMLRSIFIRLGFPLCDARYSGVTFSSARTSTEVLL